MTEPTIICPSCKTEIKLTESLAAPLIESTRREYEKRRSLFNAQDDIDRRRGQLIAEIEGKLQQKVISRQLFAVRWQMW